MIIENKTSILSNREKQILELISNGYVAKEVACELGLSTNTIETVKKNIIQKLNSKNTAHAVKIAITTGEIQ